MYVCIDMTVSGVIKIRTVRHYHAQIYIVLIKLLKQNQNSLSLGNNEVNMEKYMEKQLWKKNRIK